MFICSIYFYTIQRKSLKRSTNFFGQYISNLNNSRQQVELEGA